MNSVRLLQVATVVLICLTGCRKDPHLQVYIDNMNAEKRLLEDTLYDLQYDYESKVAEVEQLRQKLESLETGGKSVLSSGDSSSDSTPDRSGRPREMFPDIPELQLPQIDEGTQREDSPQGAERSIDDLGDPDDLAPPKLDLGDGTPVSSIPLPANQRVTQLFLNPTRTRGLQQDKRPGDDGIVVAFEPRNRDRQYVPKASRVSIVLLDPDSRQRVARWELTSDEIESALHKTPHVRGIQLALPWQETPPSESRLHLFVRYWLPDGQAVEADQVISIKPSDQIAARWTPRTEQRPDRSKSRFNVVDNEPAPPASGEQASESDSWEAAAPPKPDRAPAKQAQRPEWRPYR